MTSRRITLTLGAAGGGLLAAAFLPAIAFAITITGGGGTITPGADDNFIYTPLGPETGVTTTGYLPYFGTSTGTEEFYVTDTSLTGDPTVGYADATVTDTDFFGLTNSDVVFTSDLPGPADVTGTTGDPTPGSFIDTYTYGDTGDYNVLTHITAVGGQTYDSDVFYTPSADYTPPAWLDTLLVDILDPGGAATAATGAAADSVGTSAVDGLTGFLGLF
jgi:hypothetical protein